MVTVHLGLRRWSPSLAGQLELPLPVTITVTPSLRPATGTESDKMIPKEYDLQIYKKFRVTVIVSDSCQCQGRRLTAFESGSAQGRPGPGLGGLRAPDIPSQSRTAENVLLMSASANVSLTEDEASTVAGQGSLLAAAALSRSEFVELELEPGAPGSSQLSVRAGRSTENSIECSADACYCGLSVVAEESRFTPSSLAISRENAAEERHGKGLQRQASAEHSMRMSIDLPTPGRAL